MSSVVADILTGIKAAVVTELGAGYRELPFSLDVAKNKFAGGTNGYACWAERIDQADGVNGYVTVDQEFALTLTETFGPAQVGDGNQRTIGEALFNRMEAVYARVARTKAGVPSRVMIVNRLVVTPILFLDSNVAVLRATFAIKYRTAV